MITLIISILCMVPAAYYTFSCGDGSHWFLAGLAGIAAFIIPALLINLILRGKMMAVINGFQTELMAFQDSMRKKITMMQMKNQVGPKFQAQLESEMADGIRNLIPRLDALDKFKIWNILASRQADTIRGQLYFQIKDYDAAAPMLKHAILAEPLTQAMTMVIYYREKDWKKLEKTFNRGVMRFKFDKGLILYALYSWILVKENKLTEALSVLKDAKGKMDNPMIENNFNAVANNKLNLFNNAPLGEQWYALGLETPPPQRVAAQSPFGGSRHAGRGALYR